MEEKHDRTAIWLTVIDALVRDPRAGCAATVADVIRLLQNVQFALKRWPWEGRSRRGTMPSRWLIDNETGVQALLWAVLAPIYGADLGILSLRLIIEVKMPRTPGDFRAVEEQVAVDTGLYFRESGWFDRMGVFVYDDCDRSQPERYGELVNALKRREWAEDVVMVCHPSMIPDRQERA